MNTPSPLVPQGTRPPKSGSNFRIAFFTIVGVHVVILSGMLIQGCGKQKSDATSAPTNNTPVMPPFTNNPMDTTMTSAIPAMTVTQAPPVLAPVTPVTPPSPAITENPGKEYIVVKGDFLASIAKKEGVTLKALTNANPGVEPTKLKVGQKLIIPGSAVTTGGAEAISSDSNTYVVKQGDVLERIAKAHNTTVKEIMTLNDLKSANSIRVNQKLKLPAPKMTNAVDPAPAAAPTPMPSAPVMAPMGGMPTNH